MNLNVAPVRGVDNSFCSSLSNSCMTHDQCDILATSTQEMYGSDYAHRDWMDWDDGWSEWYPKLGFGGYCYFYRTTIPSLWSVEPQSRHTNRSLVLPLGDKYKITVHYFSYDKAYRDEAVSYVYRVDEEKLPYRWIEARSHHIHVWLNGIEDVKSWLTKAPNRLNGKPVKIEWSDTSLFGRKSQKINKP